jgi:glucose/arabinose dehydrogenase
MSFRALTLIVASFFSLPTYAQDPDPAVGQALYGEVCAQCHGVRLQGGKAQSLVDGIWQFGSSSSHIRRNIKHGITHLGMPAFEGAISEDQIRSIVAFLKGREKEVGVTPPPIPSELQSQDHLHIKVDIFAGGLELPWAIDFPDDRTALITERPGRLRMVRDNQMVADPVAGTPEVVNAGQGGLMDVAIDPEYARNGWIYLAYSHQLDGVHEGERRERAMTRLVRGHIVENAWTGQEVIFEAPHDTYVTTRHHYGCRIVFDPDGYLYFSIGDRGRSSNAQDLTRPNGKIHRIHPDGSIPDDNPFIHIENALPSIYSYGHRNPQGLAIHPVTGRLWITEHGPMGGDELNLITAGVNYGWPEITYGLNYNGTVITDNEFLPDMQQPNWYWKPSIAVCGLDFVRGDLFPKWRNHLLVGALKYEEVQLLTLHEDRVLHFETILKNAGRVRDVQTGPDGAVYIVLNTPGTVLKLTPGEGPMPMGE